jgi:hypothetical protein
MDAYERAVALMAEHDDEADFVGSRPPDLIAAAEQAIGFRFPPTYRRFVSEYGAGSFGSTEVYGVITEDWERSSAPDAVWLYLDERRDRSSGGLFAFYDAGNGERFCLDPESADADGEMRVVAAHLGDAAEAEVIAPDFGAALLMLIEQELDS